MASKLGPRIVTDNLVLALDCADAKSYAGEPTTNLLLYPESINSGPIQESWSGTITQNAVTAPDGTMTATKIEATSGYVYERLYINTSYNGVSFGVGDTITYSVWIKMLDGTQTTSNGPYIWNYNSPTYGIVVRDLSGLGPDWKLYKMTYTIQSHQTNFSISYSASNGGVTGTYAIWHPQLEVKSYNTPYVETSRSATDGWVDLSGNSNDGTLVNDVATGTSHYRSGDVILPNSARYLDFDGSDQYVDCGNAAAFSNSESFSVEAWFKYEGSGGGYFPIISKEGSSNEFGYGLKIDGSVTGAPLVYAIATGTSGSNRYQYASPTLSSSNWYHVCATFNASAGYITLYLNGSKNHGVYAVQGSFSGTQTSNNLKIAANSSAYFNGKVAGAKIYSDVLTAAEVLDNYNSTKSRFS